MLEDREFYRSSNRVALSRLPVLIAGSIAASIVASCALVFFFKIGWYLIFLIPCLVALLLALCVAALVGFAQCRNRWLAGVIGSMSGAIAYLGYFYISFCLMIGMWISPIQIGRIIEFRMKNDVQREVGRNEEEEPDSFMNWFTFAFEFLSVAGICAGFAWARSRRAFCEEQKQWFTKEKLSISPGYGESVIQFMEDGCLNTLVPKLKGNGNQNASTTLTLEYVQPKSGKSAFDFPMYLSIQDTNSSRRWKFGYLLSQCKLLPDEVIDLLPVFPEASKFLGEAHAEVRELVKESQAEQFKQLAQHYDPTQTATIEKVSDSEPKLLSTRSYPWLVNFFDGVVLLGFLLTIGLITLGLWNLEWGEGAKTVAGWILASVFLTAAVVVGIASMYAGLYLLGVPSSLWINTKLRHMLKQRPQAPNWVDDPERPLMGLTSRDKFTKVSITLYNDLMIVNLDSDARLLHMYGDQYIYTIPVDAIMSCEPERFFASLDREQRMEIWCTKLLVNLESGPAELLIAKQHVRLTPFTNKRRCMNEIEFCNSINRLKNPVPATTAH
jgi:hypothetical protein